MVQKKSYRYNKIKATSPGQDSGSRILNQI